MRTILALSLLTGWFGGDDRLPFSDRDRNFKLTYPFSWEEVPVPPGSPIQLALKKDKSVIVVSAMEMRMALEEFQAFVERDIRSRPGFSKIITRKSGKVAGAESVEVKALIREGGRAIRFYSTVFVHQGIAYRIYGSPVGGDEKDFAKDFTSVLKSISFLGNRRLWLAQYNGLPRPTELWGGLASFSLNRPRWQESALGNPQYPLYREDLQFRFWAGGSLLYARIRESARTQADELRGIEQEMAAWMKEPKIKRAEHTVGGKPFPYTTITGEFKGFPYVIRAAAKIVNGVSVHVWLEGPRSQRAETERDWKTVLNTLKVQDVSEPDIAFAFPWRKATSESNRASDPVLATILAKAKRVARTGGTGRYLSFAPDGKQGLLIQNSQYFLNELATRQLQPLRMTAYPSSPITWSNDGRNIAFLDGDKIAVLNLKTNRTATHQVNANSVSFGPATNQLLVCTDAKGKNSKPYANYLGRYGRKLELLNTDDGKRTTLLTFPLARIGLPMISPDGKRIALVTNRDYPRTASVGGNLYICNADGGELRQLTREPEEIRSIAWSADGKSLFIVRRIAVGKNGAVGQGGDYDLCRIDVKSGKATNLTRCGGIINAWIGGGDAILDVYSVSPNPSQNGLFRIPLKTLEAVAAEAPAPPVANPPEQARKLTQQLRTALGKTTWKKVVPTPEILRRFAKDFADAVQEIYGKKLDFSTASLDMLQRVANQIPFRNGGDPILVLGCGAYYGETLQRTLGAEWRLQPVPFGEWRPQSKRLTNPLVEIVLPFSQVYAHGAAETRSFMISSQTAIQNTGRKTLLVYPAAVADAVFEKATPPEYRNAMQDLDKGKLFSAFGALQQLMNKHLKNQLLAETTIRYCESAELLDLADEITEEAVKGGNTSSFLLLRYGDQLLKSDPKSALVFLRKAASANQFASAQAYLQLGKCYQRLGRVPTAESCWRVAYRLGLRQEVLQLLRDAGLFPAGKRVSNQFPPER